jgi:uncharacterized repeat protein (TIGR01451 family)
MNRNIALSAVAMTALILIAPNAFAATQAGTKVHNAASVTYKVGGVDQTAPPAGTADFLVDRKVDFTVTEVGGTTTTATPGATSGASVVTKFQVVNNTNDLLDVKLDAVGLGSGTVFDAATAGDGAGTITSTQDATGITFKLYADTNTNGSYDAGTDLELPKSGGTQYYIDGLAGAGATATVFAIANKIPDLGGANTVVDGDTFAVKLTGTAAAAYASPDGTSGLTWDVNGVPTWTAGTGALGADLANTASDTSTKVDNVLAESADNDFSPVGAAKNGVDAAIDVYELGGAAIIVTKRSAVYWDPINQFSSPKAIPGSVVLYCITVSNTGTAAASDVAVNDIVPANTTFEEGATDTDDATGGVQSLSDGVTTLANTNSLRFSSADSCTAANWNTAGQTAGMWEDSDSAAVDSGDTDLDGIPNDDEADTADGRYGDYDSGTIKTIVTSLGSGTPTPQYTTAMFLVKVN